MTKLIELDNLTKEYNGQVVLKGIHLEINDIAIKVLNLQYPTNILSD